MEGTTIDPCDDTLPTRSDILKRLSAINDYCEQRLLKGRVRNNALERVRQGWARVTIDGFKAYLSAIDGDGTDDKIVRDGIVYTRTITDGEEPVG